jgi:hypothetical protein
LCSGLSLSKKVLISFPLVEMLLSTRGTFLLEGFNYFSKLGKIFSVTVPNFAHPLNEARI